MAGNVLALWKPSRSEARAELHDCIEALAAAEQRLVDARAAVGRAFARVDLSAASLALSEAAVVDCKASLASAMSASSTSSATLKARDGALRQARADEQSAADTLEASQTAIGAAQKGAIDAAKAVEEAKAAIKNAANAVVADEALAPAIQRCRSLRAELDATTINLTAAINVELAVLKFLGDNRERVARHHTISAAGHPSFATVTLEWPRADEFSEAYKILEGERKVFDGEVQQPVRKAWAVALARLQADADAPLPSN